MGFIGLEPTTSAMSRPIQGIAEGCIMLMLMLIPIFITSAAFPGSG